MRFSISVLIAATGLSGALASPTVSARQAPGTFDTFSSPDCSADRSVVDTNRDGPPFGQLAGGIQSIISHFPPNCALILTFGAPNGPPYLVVDESRAEECIFLDRPSELLFWRRVCN